MLGAGTRRTWPAALVALCAARVAIPLAALAASGSALPGLPRYDFEPTPGDAQGFYSAAREFLASWQRLGVPVVAALALALAAAAVAIVRVWRVRPGLRGWLVVAGALVLSLTVALAITEISPRTGAAVFGWPLLWALPMLPYRALGLPLDPEIAFGFGLTLSLAANVVTVVATWVIGLRATGSRWVALGAAGLYALWPFASGLVSGAHGWTNGTWQVDAGLHLYDEPISTALVASAVALLLGSRLTPVVLASAGVVLGLATAVRLSNGLFAAVATLLLAGRVGLRAALLFAAGAASLVPVVAAWWPRGYAAVFDRPDIWPPRPFALDYAGRNWTDSLFFSPRALLVLVPLAVVGALTIRRTWALAVLGSLIVVNALFYSFYANTAEHPRFLHVTLPALLVLWSAGAAAAGLEVGKALRRRARSRGRPHMIPP